MPGLLPFRLGAFSVAVDGEASVVPVTIVGSRSALRDGQWIPRPGAVSIRIASPIDPPAASGEESLDGSGQEIPVSFDEETTGHGRGSAPAVSSLEAPHGSRWERAVKLRDAARSVILAQCGEPDLGARHDVLDALRRRKREEGAE